MTKQKCTSTKKYRNINNTVVCHADSGWVWGKWGVGEGEVGGIIDKSLSPEPKEEGTCNFTNLFRKVRLSFIPNYS